MTGASIGGGGRTFDGKADGPIQVDSPAGITPALVSRDGAWQLGYQLEDIPDGWAAIFIPRAPPPMSGDLFYVPKDRVAP